MNHLFRLILWGGIAAATAFTGCTKDIEEPADNGENQGGTEIRLHVEMADTDDTRATIDVGAGIFTGAWEKGDAMGLCSTFNTDAMAKPIALTYDGTYFRGTLPGAGSKGDWKYNAFSPMGVAGYNKYATVAYVAFDAVRTQQGNKFNSLFDPLAADQLTCLNSDPGMNGDQIMKLTLHRLTSIMYFDLSTADAAVQNEKVKSIILTADKDIAANRLAFKFNQEGAFDQSKANLRLEANNVPTSKSITLEYAAGTEPTAADFKGFFNLLPGDYTTFTVQVFTEGHKTSFTVDRTGKSLVAGKLYTKTMAITQWEELSDPTAVWVDNDITATHEVLGEMDVRINIMADRGIKNMTVDINSESLVGSGLLTQIGLDAHMNLVTPATTNMASALQSLGFPVGDQLLNKSAAPMDISGLIPMLLMVSQVPSEDHTFVLTITDNTDVVSTHSLKFHTTIPGKISYNKDADLWKNTATLTAAVTSEQFATTKVLYKRSDKTTWNEATRSAQNANGTFTASIAPSWNTTQNDAGNEVKTPNPETGVFAGATYDFKLVTGDVDVEGAAGQFTADAGNTFVDGSFETSWKDNSQFLKTDTKTYDFWGSGYNSFAKDLCTKNTTMVGLDGLNCAKMSATYNTLGKVPAPGNLFTADFKVSMSPMGGYVSFGKKYAYNARPTAVKVKVNAKLGNVNYNLHGGPIAEGDPDKARIMVCIVDWSTPREVFAGKNAPTGTWDPDKDKEVSQGKVIGYASKMITESTVGDALEEITIPIYYNEDTPAAPAGNYTIVVSCSTSAYGDYMNACTTNVMYVDDFKWVY